jgi:choline dehydrogenase-like flavoprotein
VLTGALCHRVLIERGRARGIVVSVGNTTRTIHASCEVILAAGAIGSPHLLLLSGVGPAAHLAEHHLPVLADLPVGQNLHDHLFFPLTFLAPRAGHRGTPAHFFGGMIKEYLFGGTWFGRSVFEMVAFVRVARTIPDLQLHTLPWAYPAPNQDSGGRPVVDLRPAFTVQPTLIYPESRGEVRLHSPDPAAAPIVDPHFLEAAADAELLLRGIELTREILGAPELRSEIGGEIEPGSAFPDRATLARELPNRVSTVYHPVGTCRMGSDDRAVVGPDLRVRGIDGLRVVDASIMPTITGGNTNAPTIAIGEKAAALVRGEERR